MAQKKTQGEDDFGRPQAQNRGLRKKAILLMP